MPFSTTHRGMLRERLQLAQAQVELDARHVEYMQKRVAELDSDQTALAGVARSLLKTMQDAQSLHIDHRDRLRAELAACNALSESSGLSR